jgi:hypothetical protein
LADSHVIGKRTLLSRDGFVIAKENYPEKGMNVYRCFLELRDLPDGYVGGGD